MATKPMTPPIAPKAEVIKPPLRCGTCQKVVGPEEHPKCVLCVKADNFTRPQFPGHAGTKEDPDGSKFAAWVKLDMAWKQNPKRQL